MTGRRFNQARDDMPYRFAALPVIQAIRASARMGL